MIGPIMRRDRDDRDATSRNATKTRQDRQQCRRSNEKSFRRREVQQGQNFGSRLAS
jgi:hypothetical protein